ncbi:MAG: hypothetical protein ACLGI9_04175, partial [Thermoanaerobaculia bacterium]
MKRTFILFALCSFLVAGGAFAQKAQTVDKKTGSGKKAEKSEKGEEKKGGMTAATFAGLELRGIGPALTSGRVGDIAVDPT